VVRICVVPSVHLALLIGIRWLQFRADPHLFGEVGKTFRDRIEGQDGQGYDVECVGYTSVAI